MKTYPVIRTANQEISGRWWSNLASIKDRFHPGVIEVKVTDEEDRVDILAGGPTNNMILRLSQGEARKLATEIIRMTGDLCQEQQACADDAAARREAAPREWRHRLRNVTAAVTIFVPGMLSGWAIFIFVRSVTGN